MHPSQTATVTFDNVGVTFRESGGRAHQLNWDDLVAIKIVTTDSGPFLEDVFYVLQGARSELVIPQMAEGCLALSTRLGDLPNFDHESEIRAMSCTLNANFPVWRRESS
jgi:hypothetical protein